MVIDAPGSDTWLSRLGHACADTLITPLNDSFVDFDLIGQVDAETLSQKAAASGLDQSLEDRPLPGREAR